MSYTATKEERMAHADGLRRLANWLDVTEFPVPTSALKGPILGDGTVATSSIWVDELADKPGVAAQLIGGRVEKGINPYSGNFVLTRAFGGGVRFTYTIDRERVCEARTEMVVETLPVAVDSQLEATIDIEIARLTALRDELEREDREVEVPKVVWDCSPSILAPRVETVGESA